ncbi:hypothetical protein [Leisingera sp. ANG-M7]|uniref:hypothetical protein n=1 Tax=Leisingera sp. ANG-M7 TaxID=1577902 RepID=UPI00057E0F79|nr:hypothetical protein [Leisingera sp. ANG-M7]KIC35608.1 hypothetical protein RA26_17875 [Leisingera sp. ANG-M7]
MKRVTATAIGTFLAAGLAIAAPRGTPEDLVKRHYSAISVPAAHWHDWHPEATHSIIVQLGTGAPDWKFSYSLSEWEVQPNWTEDPRLMEAMQGYKETGRSEAVLEVTPEGSASVITARTQVSYVWGKYDGVMTQTDRFDITTLAGRPLIRSLTSTYDYR